MLLADRMDVTSAPDCKALINEFNATDDATTLGHCIHQLFEHAADSYPDKVTLICASKKLTFGELNALANRFARVLVQRGVRCGDLVGVAIDRSVDLLVVLLAVLKTGAAYIPIDPTFPAERISQMIDDASPKLVIASASTSHVLTSWKGASLSVDETRHDMNPDADISNLEMDVQADDLAYVMYTSGSTGRPKGVEVSHGAVSNFLRSMQRELGCSKEDRLLAISTISFDMAVYELFMPLVSGATIVVAQTHQLKDAGALLELMEHHTITTMLATPTTWQMLLDSGWRGRPRLETIISGGEGLSYRLAERLLVYGDTVWNAYGPTEATGCASVWRVRGGEDVVIGKPIANVRLYVLDADLSPVPLGCSGELYIGGAGVARGYHNNAELTQSRFLNNPYHEGLLYRTGDLARFLAPEMLSVLGRADGQVKVRGHRIEVGDIEAAITAHGDVSVAIVVSRDGRLVAYYVRDANTSTPMSGEVDRVALTSQLRKWLAGRLPAYMVPALFVELDALPVTLNGKIDRKALPDPMAGIQVPAGRSLTTELERHILEIWSGVLGHDRISVDDNFFHIGGDSARVVRVQAELVKLIGRPVSSAKLFEHYTIKTLAAHLAGEDKASPKSTYARHRAPRNNEDIAIVSMACRLPGGITTPEDFWELLDTGGDAITDVPKDRWDADALYDADPDALGKSYCRRGGFVTSIGSFDARFFGISSRESRGLDPMQHMMLETCWEGFERAGYTTKQLRGSQTGVFIGISNVPAHQSCIHARGLADLDGYAGTGSAGSTMSGRVSYTLGLEGPALTVDTACSSSLVATHLACAALRQGECDMAVAGGVSLMLTPGLHVEFSQLRAISVDGRCRAFAADTQGTGLGEGCAAVVLKRLSDAQHDGDTVHAVLRGTAVNHDGRSSGLTAPSGSAQQRLIHAALAASSLQPADIDYIEAHGTGTRLGDPIEGTALAEVFGGSHSEAEPLWIGSAKSNIGHTQAAAGLVGILKVVLALQHGILPRTLHVTEPTPAVDWQGANMALVQRARPWLPEGDRLRRSGVSAFGIGGTNAHVIIEEPPKPIVGSSQTAPLPPVVPFLVSGHTQAALRQQAAKLQRHISWRTDRDRFGDVAHSLATTRSHFRHRLVLMAKDTTELLEKLASAGRLSSLPASDHASEPRLAMLFTGQGSQLPCMGRDLGKVYPLFRESLQEIAAHFTGLEKPLLDVMWADPDSQAAALLHRTDFAQPALFTLEVGLWRLWQSWGVRPEVVLGHSVGELAAAHVAGILDLPSACRLVAARGRLMQAVPSHGKMVSLEASVAEVTSAIETLGLGAKVDIAGHNTPTQTVASGDAAAVESVAAHFARQARKVKTLDVSHAFHSHHMDGILAAFQTVAQTIRFEPPRIAVVSSLTGKLAQEGQLEQPSYWVQQARRPVLFSDGMRTLSRMGISVFLELGPRPVLSGMGAALLSDNDNSRPTAWLPSLVPGKGGASVAQSSLAELHMRHVPVDWAGYFKPFGCKRVELPTYAFQRHRLDECQSLARSSSTLALGEEANEWDKETCSKVEWALDLSLGLPQALDQIKKRLSLAEDKVARDLTMGLRRVCVYFCHDSLRGLTSQVIAGLERHHVKFHSWMQDLLSLAASCRLGPDSDRWTLDGPQERQRHIARVAQQSVDGELVCRLGPHLMSMLRGQRNPLEVMMEDKLLYKYYAHSVRMGPSLTQCAALLRQLIHKNPRARVLEIGAGTGGATRHMLRALGTAKEGGPLAASWHFTDVSSGFFEAARTEFAAWTDLLEFDRLDIEKDPASQGFELASYDIVVACQVLHATKCMARTMANVRSLMKPGATLLLMETTQDAVDLQFIFGLLPGWWLSEEPERQCSPSLTVPFWDQILRGAGFSGIDVEIRDCESDDMYTVSTIMSRVPLTQKPKLARGRVILVTSNKAPPPASFVDSLQKCIEGFTEGLLPDVLTVTLEAATNSSAYDDNICVFVGEIDRPILRDLDQVYLQAIKSMATNCKGLLWVTAGGAVNSEAPELSLSQGLLRALRNEYAGRRYILLDLDPHTSNKWSQGTVSAITQVLEAGFGHIDDANLTDAAPVEFEYAERDGLLLVPRLYKDTTLNRAVAGPLAPGWQVPNVSMPKEPLFQQDRPLRLQVGIPGVLDTLVFGDDDINKDSSLPPDMVEIEPRAYGLNFRDAMVAMGQLKEQVMGIECSGIVTRLGTEAQAQGYKVGSRVMALLLGHFASRAHVSWHSIAHMPQGLSFEDAASLPVIFSTAYVGLIDVARLRRGQSVLVHTAAGGVGQAALMLAKHLGAADIYATVGSQQERELIMGEFGIPAERIFSSRDTSFVPAILTATGGRGVDVVLNSLVGPLLQASCDVLAPFGHFVEIGKKDLEGNNPLEMGSFSRVASFAALDMKMLLGRCGPDTHRVLNEVARLVQKKILAPIRPVTVYPMQDAAKAFRLLQTGKHTGKVVLSTGPQEEVKVLPRAAATARLRPNASYLLVGDMGGIERSIGHWMIDHGARNLILLSRSAADLDKTGAFIVKMREAGCRVMPINCDVSIAGHLAKALRTCEQEGLPPVQGVIQGAMVLKDSTFEKMKLDDWQTCIRPMVDGTFHVHTKFSQPGSLDFFITLSSLSGILGFTSKTNYAAGSAYQDALARWRQDHGLPGVSVNLGAVKGVGYMAEMAGAADRMRNGETLMLTDDAVLQTLQAAILHPMEHPQILLGLNPGPGAQWDQEGQTQMSRDALYLPLRYRKSRSQGGHRTVSAGGPGGEPLATQLAQAESRHAAVRLVGDAIVAKLAVTFMIPTDKIDLGEPPTLYGVDSLVAVELRNMLVRQAAAELSIFSILQSASLAALASDVVAKSKHINLSV